MTRFVRLAVGAVVNFLLCAGFVNAGSENGWRSNGLVRRRDIEVAAEACPI